MWPLGFKKPPGGEIGSANHVLNDHTYCCQLNPKVCEETGEPQAKTAKMCWDWHKKRIGQRSTDAKKLGIPLVISEFGACMDSKDCAREIDQVAAVSDQELASWAYWEFKPFHDLTTSAGDRSEGFYNLDGSLQIDKVRSLSRTYIKAAQGTIMKQFFVSDTMEGSGHVAGEFSGSIKIDTSVNATTDIHVFVAQGSNFTYSWYPHGFDISFPAHSKDKVQPDIQNIALKDNTVTFQVMNEEFDGHYLNFVIEPYNGQASKHHKHSYQFHFDSNQEPEFI